MTGEKVSASAMRVCDPVGGKPDLNRFFYDYERYFRVLDGYHHHLRYLIAGYSRGDQSNELSAAFSFAVAKLVEADEASRRAYGDDKRKLSHQGLYAELFRASLIFLTFGLCLRAPQNDIEAILRCGDRGDPLIETLARAAAPGSEKRFDTPAFYDTFDGLYDALRVAPQERENNIHRYLGRWYSVKMEGFSFKGEHLSADQPDYVGYWCFEAAGIVAALGIADRRLAGHPHYPRDLVAMYRA
jgi:PoNe immunity proteins (PoNi), C-terminal